MKKTYYLLTLSILAFACSGKVESPGSNDMGFTESAAPVAQEKMAAQSSDVDYENNRSIDVKESVRNDLEVREEAPVIKMPDKIIKEADIKFEVKDYNKSRKLIAENIKKWGAYISNEDERHEYNQIVCDMTIRVLSKDFEKLLNDVGDAATRMDYRKVRAMDVSEEYVDVVSRIKTKKEVEQRYLEILRRAAKIQDILDVEDRIRIIREEIEAKEGQLRYLEDRVGYSTINLSIYQITELNPSAYHEPGFFQKIGNAFKQGWRGLQALVIGVTYIWPLLIIVALVIFFVNRYLNRKKISN